MNNAQPATPVSQHNQDPVPQTRERLHDQILSTSEVLVSASAMDIR